MGSQASIVDPVLTTEAAHILACSTETVRLLERSGRLLALRTSRGVRLFERRDVERLAAERRAAKADVERLVEERRIAHASAGAA